MNVSKDKIIILRKLLKEYGLYFRYYDKTTCYMPKIKPLRYSLSNILSKDVIYKPYIYNNLKFCIYFHNHKPQFFFLKRYPEVRDIDIIIKRYRAKLFNDKRKWNNYINRINLLKQNTNYQ